MQHYGRNPHDAVTPNHSQAAWPLKVPLRMLVLGKQPQKGGFKLPLTQRATA